MVQGVSESDSARKENKVNQVNIYCLIPSKNHEFTPKHSAGCERRAVQCEATRGLGPKHRKKKNGEGVKAL